MQDRGYIYKGKYEGWYCVSDEAFLTPVQVADGTATIKPSDTAGPWQLLTTWRIEQPGVDKQGNPCKVSLESGHVVEWVVEENYKFKLSAFQKPLLRWLENTDQGGSVIPRVRANELFGLLRVRTMALTLLCVCVCLPVCVCVCVSVGTLDLI